MTLGIVVDLLKGRRRRPRERIFFSVFDMPRKPQIPTEMTSIHVAWQGGYIVYHWRFDRGRRLWDQSFPISALTLAAAREHVPPKYVRRAASPDFAHEVYAPAGEETYS